MLFFREQARQNSGVPISVNTLPDDVETLQRLVMEQSQRNESQSAEALHLRATIEMLKIQIARLKRAQFGRSSEQLGDRIAQLELLLEDLQATQGERVAPPPIEPIEKPTVSRRT